MPQTETAAGCVSVSVCIHVDVYVWVCGERFTSMWTAEAVGYRCSWTLQWTVSPHRSQMSTWIRHAHGGELHITSLICCTHACWNVVAAKTLQPAHVVCFINLTASPQVEITLMGGNAWQTQTDTNKECYIAQGRSVIWCGDLEKRRYEWRVLLLRLMKRLMWLQRVAPPTVCHICCIYYTWRAANMMISILQTAVHNRTVKNLICSIWEVKLKSDALVFIDMHRHVLYSFQVSGEPALIYWEI